MNRKRRGRDGKQAREDQFKILETHPILVSISYLYVVSNTRLVVHNILCSIEIFLDARHHREKIPAGNSSTTKRIGNKKEPWISPRRSNDVTRNGEP